MVKKRVDESSSTAGFTSAHHAALKNDLPGMKSLIQCRHTINCFSNSPEWEMPIHTAAKNGHTQIVDLLVRARISVNERDYYGRTPLMVAIKAGHICTVAYLLALDADHTISDRAGYTAMHYAANQDHPVMIRMLVNAGSERLGNAIAKDGMYAMHIAAKRGKVELVRILWTETDMVRMDVRDNRGESPLSYAIKGGHQDVVDFFMEKRDGLFMDNVRVYSQVAPLYIIIMVWLHWYFLYVFNDLDTDFFFVTNALVLLKGSDLVMFAVMAIGRNCDPGFLPEATPRFEVCKKQMLFGTIKVMTLQRICFVCKCFKSPNTEHCHYCMRCVSDYYSHCSYFSQCIGKRNRLLNLMYLMYVLLSMFVMAVLMLSNVAPLMWGAWHMNLITIATLVLIFLIIGWIIVTQFVFLPNAYWKSVMIEMMAYEMEDEALKMNRFPPRMVNYCAQWKVHLARGLVFGWIVYFVAFVLSFTY